MRKKVFASIVFLVTMLFAVVGWARLITVGSSGCDYTSIHAVFDSEDLEPGDVIEVRADSPGGTKIYHEPGVIHWYAEDSGTADNPVVLRGREGDTIIISCIDEIEGWDESSNWTDDGNNVWYMTYSHTPGRLLIDDQEVIMAESSDTVNSTYRWYYDTSNTLLYVYSEGNPATTYSSIKGSKYFYPLFIREVTGARVENLQIIGGYSASIYVGYSDYITITKCRFGELSPMGVKVIENTSTHDPSTNVSIIDNIIDSGFDGYYEHSNIGVYNGVLFTKGVTNSKIISNYIANWGHNCVEISATSADYHGVYNNVVSDNTFEGKNISYGRAVGLGGPDGKCYNNVITRNIMRNFTVRNQINGNNNEFSYNLIINMTNSPCKTYGTAQGIDLQAFDPYICHDNVIANNIIVNCEEAGIRLRTGANNKENNIIANNIIYNCGTNSKDGLDGYGIVVDNASDILNNTFQNNVVYNLGISNVIYYRGTAMTVSTWNDSDSSGDVIEGNLQADPLLTSNYHLSHDSPCIDAGTKLSIHDSDWQDLAGNTVRYGTAPDIGCYEYKTWPMGAWGMLPWIGGRHKVQWTPYE